MIPHPSSGGRGGERRGKGEGPSEKPNLAVPGIMIYGVKLIARVVGATPPAKRKSFTHARFYILK